MPRHSTQLPNLGVCYVPLACTLCPCCPPHLCSSSDSSAPTCPYLDNKYIYSYPVVIVTNPLYVLIILSCTLLFILFSIFDSTVLGLLLFLTIHRFGLMYHMYPDLWSYTIFFLPLTTYIHFPVLFQDTLIFTHFFAMIYLICILF